MKRHKIKNKRKLKIMKPLAKLIYEYPCKECIVLPCCSELCDKTKKMDSEVIRRNIIKNICPDCGKRIETIRRPYFTHQKKNFKYECEFCNHIFKNVDDYYFRETKDGYYASCSTCMSTCQSYTSCSSYHYPSYYGCCISPNINNICDISNIKTKDLIK